MRMRVPLVGSYWAATLFVAFTAHAIAQDSYLPIDITSFFPKNSSPADASALQTIVGEPTADDFVLGADGMIGTAADPQQLADQSSNNRNSKLVLSTPEAEFQQPKLGSFEVPECGPSPFTPDQIEQLVTEAAERHGVDISLATAITFAESRFDQQRNSPAGARGPMQLMPDTAALFGVADVCDPASNIDGGVRYLEELVKEFGNPLLAAAAYNAGKQRIYQYGGIPPFYETVSYIATVLNFQMGIEMVATTNPPSNPASSAATATPSSGSRPPSGIIQDRKPGEFVAGVMQF